ncbi:hypothetical protein SAMN05192555_104111 [Franzmannia pantelleriensis]|uniref:Uncharacterized protein n=1 Tax=Franzmannia pantelleriensis TaxID=48727 RepID=A0A1G9JQ34_9GAMM|nr:hypothetical protein [Halomonas pantelleriensis]SDL39647.1 hypothetical protein SAMN05192555_104111 [Halomonas pantelleriensis]
MLRALSLLRSLHGAHHSLEDARASVQRACDYRWLRGAMAGCHVTESPRPLADATPCLVLTQLFPATAGRLRGGNWPTDAGARERCRVEGAHACRAAGAPAYRTLESLSQGLVHGAMTVLIDAARLDYLIEQQALWLSWRRPERLDGALAGLAGQRLGQASQGVFVLELRVPGRDAQGAPNADWLDRQLDRYRKLLRG